MEKTWKFSRLFVKTKTKTKTLLFVLEVPWDQDFGLKDYITALKQTRAKQAQACNTATCLRISDIFTYLFRYLLIHSITY